MSTTTITIPCATDPYPNNFCLITGDSDCAVLCGAYDSNNCQTLFCAGRVVVIQICNSNAAKDDNFDFYLNNTLIGRLDLNYYAQVGSLFIGDLNTNYTVTQPDFTCPLDLMQVYRFRPNVLIKGINSVFMDNTQQNFNQNFGTVEVRSYEISGNNLINPVQIANKYYSPGDGQDWSLTFSYTECTPATPDNDILT